MHVVHLYDGHERVYRGRGSVPGVVWNLARETAAAGHEVTVVERRWDGLPAAGTHDGVRFRRLDVRTGADEPWERVPYEVVDSMVGLARLVGDRTNFGLQSLRVLRGLEYDVLHVHLPLAANVLATLAPWLRDRMVFTAHLGELRLDALDIGGSRADDDEVDGDADEAAGPAGTGAGPPSDLPSLPSVLTLASPDVYLARRAARTTVLNHAIERVFVERGVPEPKLAVVPNGVDVERFSEVDERTLDRVRETYGVDESPTLLFVGTVLPRKGVDDLVRATALLDERNAPTGVGESIPFRLIVAGEDDLDGEYAATVRELAIDLGLDERVSFAGFVPDEDLPALYALADVFVLPSLEEGFGMPAIEAMAAGTPVVATRVGGLPEVLDDGKHGRLVEPGDVDGLAAAIADVLADAAERAGDRGGPRAGQMNERSRSRAEQMGERAHARAEDFSWSRIAATFESVYREVAP